MSSSLVQSYAFVTLLSSQAYLPGALVLAHALRALHPKHSSPIPFKLVCLVTPETVDARAIKQLRDVWDLVVGVEVLECPGQEAGLDLLGRPDLATVLTKLHVFRLAPFTKVIFLDADVLPLRALSHLFALPHPFSAAPDTGWPDCFNSGVMVLEPSEATFEGLREMMLAGKGQKGGGSFDGGDQGILNQYFNGEDGRPEWNRISFTYNTTPTAAYTYAPAYSHYGPTISCVHFIGANKPWSSLSYRASRPAPSENLPFDYQSLVDRWFGVYDKYVRPSVEGAKRFEVPANVAAWEAPRSKIASLGLEELKKVATQGWAQGATQAGGYTSLPLDGRIDLMRPRLASPESTTSTLSDVTEVAPEAATKVISPQPIHPSGAAYFAQWDPARGPPPKGEGRQYYQMQEPMDSKYGNTWDATEQEKKAAEKRWREGGQGGQAVWEVPKELRDGRYNVTSQQQDSSLVGKVFPWESRHRKTASRVFPKGDSPPPANQPTSPDEQPRPTHQRQFSQQPYHAPPPPANFHQAMKSYSNAWDAVPAIQKYVTRLSEPPRSGPSAGGHEGNKTPPGGRGRRDDRSAGVGGRKEPSRDGADGDDEDEESEESEPRLEHDARGLPKRRDDRGGGGGSSTGSRGTSRGGRGGGGGASDHSSSAGGNRGSSSHSSTQHGNPSSSHFSNASAQTDPAASTFDAGTQYESGSEASITSGSSTPTNSSQERERTSLHSPRDQRPPAGTAHSLVPVPPLRSVGPPSPQEEMASLKRYNFEGAAAATKKATPTAPDLAHTRQESTETITSVGTSAGLVTPPTESAPRLGGGGAAAPKGRSWDSKRDVDAFRTETVSVLQRFMRDAQEQREGSQAQ